MPSPFPGMDPYLERPARWHPFPTRLVTALAQAIEPLLPPRYYVEVEERACVTLPEASGSRVPDLAVVDLQRDPAAPGGGAVTVAQGVEVWVPAPDVERERYLEVRDIEDERVVTVVEVLSPANKQPGPGRDDYLAKRGAVLASRTSLLEIDLLRRGPRMPALGAPEGADYGILVSRAHARPRALFLPFSVRDPAPGFPLPLHPGDEEPLVSLGPVLGRVYDEGRYAARIDYSRPPEPPLEGEDAAWGAAPVAARR